MKMKDGVKSHWEAEVCGSRYGSFEEIDVNRYAVHEYLTDWADFSSGKGLKMLEIGLGTGADAQKWVESGADYTGLDLTEAAVETTRERLSRLDDSHQWTLQRGDAENLPFEDNSFDFVYSFGVLHHTPQTERAFSEVCRVLRPGGRVRAMVYRTPSWVGVMMAARYLKSPRKASYEELESPGTKLYNFEEMRALLQRAGYADIDLKSRLAPGDLLTIEPSAKHKGGLFSTVKALYPRPLIRMIGHRMGFHLLIDAVKPGG